MTHDTPSPRFWIVNQQHPAADDNGSGTAESPFKTIAPAAKAAQPGDTVQVHAGLYRERVKPAQSGTREAPITYTAAPDETVILSASEAWSPDWQPVVGGNPRILSGKLDPALFPSAIHNPYKRTLVGIEAKGLTCGQVFLDGKPLAEMGYREALIETPGSWWYDPKADAVLVHFPDEPKSVEAYRVELTTRTRNFAPEIRGTSWIHVNGFIMEHAGNQCPVGFYVSKDPDPSADSPPAQAGALGFRGGIGWKATHNTIRYAKATAIDIAWEGYRDEDGLGQPPTQTQGLHVIENNVIEYNGGAGIIGLGAFGTVIRNNVIRYNARLGLGGTETSGIKVHYFVKSLIEGNLIQGNDTSGIWVDNVWRDSRITRNVIVGNAEAGIFVEMGLGPILIDNNIIAHTRPMGMPGDGIYSHESSGVTLVHNLIFGNANFGVWWHVAGERSNPPARVSADPSKITSPHEPQPWTDRETGKLLGESGLFGEGQTFGRKDLEMCGASNWDVRNNMILANGRGAISAPHPFESENKNHSRDNHSDYNLLAGNMDLVTSETWATELDQPLFVWNTNKMRVDIQEIAKGFDAWMDKEDVPAGNRPGIERWIQQPYLMLREWQGFVGHDQHSVHGLVLRSSFCTTGHWFQAAFDETPESMHCPAIAGVTEDFFGQPIDPHRVLPGPFQSLELNPGLRDNPSPAEYRGPYNYGHDDLKMNFIAFWPRGGKGEIRGRK